MTDAERAALCALIDEWTAAARAAQAGTTVRDMGTWERAGKLYARLVAGLKQHSPVGHRGEAWTVEGGRVVVRRA